MNIVSPDVQNRMVSRVEFANDKKVCVLENHTFSLSSSLQNNGDKEGKEDDNDDDDVGDNNADGDDDNALSSTFLMMMIITWNVLPSLCPIIWLYQYNIYHSSGNS